MEHPPTLRAPAAVRAGVMVVLLGLCASLAAGGYQAPEALLHGFLHRND